jgi:UDP-GlcNAc:undecaprenyl-phosphate GlcNAc-1-phosphate transferase
MDVFRLTTAFWLALLIALAAVPLAIRIARRYGCYDHPVGYKGHASPTPYLGGAAMLAAFVPVALLLGGGAGEFAPLIGCAVVLCAIGTIDDIRTVSPWWRVAVEAAAAVVLWSTGLGWSLFSSEALNLVVTVLWIVGLVNAFNLMDNMDGAASIVALAAAGGVAAIAGLHDDLVLAALALALCGGCAGFLRYNLATPARIFLGDGGSMWVGFVVAGAVMALPSTSGADGLTALVIAALLVGLPVVDTSLVVVSRRRQAIPLMTGGRDHLTHRLHARLRSARAVAATLGLLQVVLCIVAVSAWSVSRPLAIALAVICPIAVAIVISVLDSASWRPAQAVAPPASVMAAPVTVEAGAGRGDAPHAGNGASPGSFAADDKCAQHQAAS